MTDLRASSTVFVVAVLVLASGPGGGITTATAAGFESDSVVQTVQPPLAVQADENNDSNVTTRHANPSEYDESGDLTALEHRLATRMTDTLDEGAIRLREGEYDRAARSLDGSYSELIDQYDEIAAETPNESRSELFELAGENQRTVINTVREYHEVKDAYEEARAAGNEERARSLARELENLAATANESSGELRENYDELEAETDRNLSEADTSIEEVNEEIQAQQTTIRETEFVPTSLTVDAEREEISFREPLTGVGRIRTADGRPIGDETIRLEVGNESLRTMTDADGSFTFEYRPTDDRLSTEQLTVEYVPTNGSVFLGSETTVDISIEQAEPTVSNLETTDEVAYGETATVSGDLHVDEVPVDGVSLAVTLGDERLGTVETTNGSFETDVQVPASVAAGERELGVRLNYEDRALAPVTATNDVTVRETDAVMDVSASRLTDEGRTVAVNGTLETVDGTGIAGQPVSLSADGTTLETVTSDPDGSVSATVEIPEEAAVGDVRIVATHDGSGSNLASATAASTVSFSAANQSWMGLPAWAVLGLGVGLLAALGLAAFAWRSRARSSQSGDQRDPEVTADRPDNPDSRSERSRTATAESLLARGHDSLARGRPDRAVEMGYAAVRHALSGRVDTGDATDALTHWEFYRRSADRGIGGSDGDRDSESGDSERALLRRVTEHYERATFDVADVSPEEAEHVLETGRRLCDLTATDDRDPSTESADR
ncbi:Ig-like domain repeat protein [Natrinema zhouii]|uniref:Ig-like domain repeat protein n=1 Tax=Natrinema zhouii TaxID=1710539 RepID=UPI001CF789E2|nr:Ig-like domain repeat protein [Natrinema zhouii]UHQ97955.1 Ig-like domain repeat protein [Natrinema zhouii]